MKTLWISTQDLRTVPRQVKTVVSISVMKLWRFVDLTRPPAPRPFGGLSGVLLIVVSMCVCSSSGKSSTFLSPNRVKESLDLYEELITEEREERDATYNEV